MPANIGCSKQEAGILPACAMWESDDIAFSSYHLPMLTAQQPTRSLILHMTHESLDMMGTGNHSGDTVFALRCISKVPERMLVNKLRNMPVSTNSCEHTACAAMFDCNLEPTR